MNSKHGSSLASINCKDVKLQLADKDIVIGDSIRKALRELSPEQQRHTMLGIHSSFSTATSYLQEKLPLGNHLLKQLRCLNPTKRNEESTASSIVIKSALTLVQANADSEHSLSVNAQIVTENRASLWEKTIVGLHVLRGAVQFCDPVGCRPELLKISLALKQAVKSSHTSYKKQRERKKEIRKKKEEEELRQKLSEEKERSRLLKKKESLAESEEDLSQQEQCAREEVKAADELLQDAKSKLDIALESNTISKSSITAAKMMLETATTKQKEAMEKLDKIQEQRKSFRATTRKLLDEILPSKQVIPKKRTSQTEKGIKKARKN